MNPEIDSPTMQSYSRSRLFLEAKEFMLDYSNKERSFSLWYGKSCENETKGFMSLELLMVVLRVFPSFFRLALR